MNANSLPNELGRWQGDDFGRTAQLFAGDGVDEGMDEVQRFGRRVARLALKRMRQPIPMRQDAIAIFLLRPSVPEGITTERQPLLGDGGIETGGKIWFVSETAQSGRELSPPSESQGAMFDYVEYLELGDVPTAVFNPTVTPPTVRLYPKGINAAEEFISLNIADREITVTDIRRVINQACDNHLCTPDAQITGVSVWAKPQDFHASKSAEAIAQLHVKMFLSLQLFNCDVRHEQSMAGGRVDLEFVQLLADGTTIVCAEIEIKVLRERNSTGKKWSDSANERWMRKGIKQAAAYRDLRRAKSGMVCCFDMRDGDRGELDTFSGVTALAEGLGVVLHRNFLYNSADTWREAKYPEPPTTA